MVMHPEEKDMLHTEKKKKKRMRADTIQKHSGK